MDNNNQEQFENLTPTEERVQRSKSVPSKMKSFVSMVAAGVIGSVLTFTVFSYTDIIDDTNYAGIETEEVAEGGDLPAIQQLTNSETGNIADVVENASKAIVGVVNIQEQRFQHPSSTDAAVETGSGSGVIFQTGEDGTYIVTNHHVIEGAKEIEISLYNGEKAPAELIGSDALTDIAILRISEEYEVSAIEFGDSTMLRPGEQVLAIGNPLGLDLSRTVTQGIVSAIERTISVNTAAGEWELEVIQTDAAINPGNSGGALINTKGQMIGINSMKISVSGVEGLGFAIPSSEFESIINEIMEIGKIDRPYMGVGLANFSEIPQFYLQQYVGDLEEGVIITNVDPTSPAAEAGLEVEDIITKINDTEINSASELRKYLYSNVSIGDEVKITVYRDGEELILPLTLIGS